MTTTLDEQLLTKKKQAWAEKRKPEILKGNKLNYNAAIQERYYKELVSLILQMTRQSKREIMKLFRSETAQQFYAEDASISAQAKIVTNQLTKKFTQLFDTTAQGLAEWMISDSDKASSNTLHDSLKVLSGGLSLKTTVLTGPLKEVMKASDLPRT